MKVIDLINQVKYSQLDESLKDHTLKQVHQLLLSKQNDREVLVQINTIFRHLLVSCQSQSVDKLKGVLNSILVQLNDLTFEPNYYQEFRNLSDIYRLKITHAGSLLDIERFEQTGENRLYQRINELIDQISPKLAKIHADNEQMAVKIEGLIDKANLSLIQKISFKIKVDQTINDVNNSANQAHGSHLSLYVSDIVVRLKNISNQVDKISRDNDIQNIHDIIEKIKLSYHNSNLRINNNRELMNNLNVLNNSFNRKIKVANGIDHMNGIIQDARLKLYEIFDNYIEVVSPKIIRSLSQVGQLVQHVQDYIDQDPDLSERQKGRFNDNAELIRLRAKFNVNLNPEKFSYSDEKKQIIHLMQAVSIFKFNLLYKQNQKRFSDKSSSSKHAMKNLLSIYHLIVAQINSEQDLSGIISTNKSGKRQFSKVVDDALRSNPVRKKSHHEIRAYAHNLYFGLARIQLLGRVNDQDITKMIRPLIEHIDQLLDQNNVAKIDTNLKRAHKLIDIQAVTDVKNAQTAYLRRQFHDFDDQISQMRDLSEDERQRATTSLMALRHKIQASWIQIKDIAILKKTIIKQQKMLKNRFNTVLNHNSSRKQAHNELNQLSDKVTKIANQLSNLSDDDRKMLVSGIQAVVEATNEKINQAGQSTQITQVSRAGQRAIKTIIESSSCLNLLNLIDGDAHKMCEQSGLDKDYTKLIRQRIDSIMTPDDYQNWREEINRIVLKHSK